MNKKQEINLEILSRIDGEIIEKSTLKRAKLIAAMGKRRGRRLAVLLVAIITLVALLTSTLIVLLMRGPDGPVVEQPTEPIIPVEKQVPIYQGMSVSDKIETPNTYPVSAAQSGGVTFLSATYESPYITAFEQLGSQDGNNGNNGNGNGNNGDNGNHNGHNKPAEEIVDENITITIPAQDMYTAQPNQDLYITVHISNPDSFEIMSFTLNGKKYSSYMFEEGSDMENLILKVNVGEAEGLIEYTIDAIKYIDGTEIKDVIMDGDRTVKVGVYSEKQPTATVTDEIVGINKMSFSVTVKDILGLLEITEGKLYAVLMDGETLIEQIELTAGEEHEIVFENLKTSTYYQYAIVACYDRLDGEGYDRYLLAGKEFYTEGIMAFDTVEIGQESVSFGVVWNENFENKTITSLSLYHGDTLLRELDTAATEITNLLSNYEYTLVATYVNGDKTESTSLDFTTEAKQTPGVVVVLDSLSHTSIGFRITATDEDSVGQISVIELLWGDEVVSELSDLTVREFTGLFTGNDYTVRVTYTYDLNDNTGEHTVTGELDVTTLAKTVPTVRLTLNKAEHTSFTFFLSTTDFDGVGELVSIELLYGDEVINSPEDFTIREFAGLLTDNEYTVRATYAYDLGDGKGEQTAVDTLVVQTLAKKVPTVGISLLDPKKEELDAYTSFGIDVNVTDEDGVGYISQLILVHGEEQTVIDDVNTAYFSKLLSGQKYQVIVKYTYDLGNGKGEQITEATIEAKTKAKPEPVLELEWIGEPDALSGSCLFKDEQSVLRFCMAEFYSGDELLETVSGMEFSFGSLEQYTEYTLKITYGYDLNNGEGEQTKTEVYTVKTSPYVGVTALEILGEVASSYNQGDSIYLRFTIDNPMGAEVTAVQINGKICSANNAMAKDTVNVAFTLDEEFASGVVNITVDKIWMIDPEDNTIEYVNDVGYASDTTVFVNDIFEVLGLQIVNNEQKMITYAFERDTIYAMITLNNPAGYAVDSVTLKGDNVNVSDVTLTGWTRLDDNTYYAKLPSSSIGTTVTYTVTDITYSSPHSTSTLDGLKDLKIKASYVNIPDENVYYISTPEQLMAISGYGYYELTGDIDLSGLSWEVGPQMLGVFNGNGYSIKNMTFIGNATGGWGGLFSVASGYIYDLHMEGITYMATATSHFHYGGIVASATDLIMKNCSVDSTSYVEITAHNPAKDNMIMDVGGVIGYTAGGEKIEIYDCVNNGAVIVRNTSEKGDTPYITAIGLGGIVGSRDVFCSLYVENCLNTGSVLLYDESIAMKMQFVGGICAGGASSDKTVEIRSCLNTGKVCVYSEDMIGTFVSGIANRGAGVTSITNCYCIEGQENGGAPFVTKERLSQKEFYTEALGWSEEIWDLSTLDAQNDKYPKLKR